MRRHTDLWDGTCQFIAAAMDRARHERGVSNYRVSEQEAACAVD